MSKPSNLNAVLHDLKGDKVKERQQGLAALRNVFARDELILNFDKKGTGEAWLTVFQALFATVGIEKATFIKRTPTSKSSTSGATATRRLSDAAATIRWLTERCVQRMNKAVVRSLFTHLLQTMVYNGQLLAPVALDYIKALRCVISWTPHLDHLNEETWVRMAEMAFNVILGDPVRRPLADDSDSDHQRDESPTLGTDLADADFYLDDDTDENTDGSVVSAGTQSKKRRRLQPATSSRHPTQSLAADRKSRPTVPRSVSLEQIEFTSLLIILLRSPSAPFLSTDSPELAHAVLQRLRRFLELYPADTSLHHDYLLALSATLSHLSLNKKYDVVNFARETWDSLVRLWGTKNKAMKEDLVVVLRALFPYYTTDQDGSPSWAEGIRKLWQLLEGEAGSRWGADGLSFDSLRLEVAPTEEEEATTSPVFVARTFQAGWHFDSGQALAWAILELQADCAEKLFQSSEAIHSFTPGARGSKGKRLRVENPVSLLLRFIESSSLIIRSYGLQILLFFISKHWSALRSSHQQDVIDALSKFVSVEDATIQSWTFLCLAAIADADVNNPPKDSSDGLQSAKPDYSCDPATWDPIWTHAIRRTNSPGVCRAACHAAHILLSHANIFLTSQRVLYEIETLAKDLDVQGPAFPYDTVCVFFSQCLKVASQDVRLYRMQLEEKVLSWLVDCWKVGGDTPAVKGSGGRSRMQPHMVGDVLLLLESICTFSKRCDLASRVLLPDCPIMDAMIDEDNTKIIQEFQLHGRLPSFRKPSKDRSCSEHLVSAPAVSQVKGDLTPPRGRERRVSNFLQKSLQVLASEFESMKETNGHPTVEQARRALDLAVVAMSFESLLSLNGILSNRRVIQCACRVVTLVTALLTDSGWIDEDKALVLLALEPLISQGNERKDSDLWMAMLPPGTNTGIRTKVLRKLISNQAKHRIHRQTVNRLFQRILFLNSDIQDTFATVMSILKDILKTVVNHRLSESQSFQLTGTDDGDGFEPIRTTLPFPQTRQQKEDSRARRRIVEVCVSFLAIVPIIQSSSGEPTRDKELTELVLGSNSSFYLVASVFFDKVGQRLLKLSSNNLDDFLQKIGALLELYDHSRSERLQLLVIHFLDSTAHLWLQDSVTNSRIGDDFRTLCHWITDMLKQNKVRSWKLRDYAARFLDRYIEEDPTQTSWTREGDAFKGSFPSALLPRLGADRDIRVRFRAAVANARLFSVAHTVGHDAIILYDDIKRWLTTNLDEYEHMLTRILSLGNMMVVSSAVRRAPYWHLLEICFPGPIYTQHIESILLSVSERLGLTSFRVLFEAYASQIAFSIRQAQKDFLQLPPHLLGFENRKECAEAVLRAFTPANLIAGGLLPETILHGKRLFESHCNMIQKSLDNGIRECFGDIIGFQIATCIDESGGNSNVPTEVLVRQLKDNTMLSDRPGEFDDLLRRNVDGIVAAILRTLGDQDFSQEGSIVQALQLFDHTGKTAQVFQKMTRYRKADDFKTHSPNLPCFSPSVILDAFLWLNALVPEVDARATSYHVLNELFADVRHSPLVNEQIRLLNAIALWVACHYSDFEEPTLLRVLTRGATSFLAQPDLVRAAQSLLDWAFGCYRKIGQKDTRFPNILIRICCLAYDYALDAESVAIAGMGNDLLQWIDSQALRLCKNVNLREQVVDAFPAFPHNPSPELTRVYEDNAPENLSAVLDDGRISSNKFRLVNRLRALSIEKKYNEKDFSYTDFWRLKECIPSVDQLQDDDIVAFASLLVLNKGRVHNFGSQLAGPRSFPATRQKETHSTPQHAIVIALLTILDGNSTTHVHVAYRTLRFLMSVFDSEIPQFQSWPPEYRTELEYLRAYPRRPDTRPLCDINELSALEPCRSLAMTFAEWITTITTLLCDTLATSTIFYAHLTPILQSDTAFADQMLPVLVHSVLQAGDNEDVSYGRLLSDYFTSLLASDTVSTACLRSIVNTVLHLRKFPCPRVTGALSHDKWLDIDFMLLARNAINCGAYSTSLLFLELAADHTNSPVIEDDTAEKILFDIYNHIDEPDGFYGIKTKDLGEILIKRFHHEKQWEKAFCFHGASVEAGNASSTEIDGLLQAFHSFGFNHLAINTLQGGNSLGNGSALGSSGMNYRLGWRTETWDLPDQTQQHNPGASVYRALRAVHRERDAQTIRGIVRHALLAEMEYLRKLGTENLAEIRAVTQNLMCLSQVTQWMSSSTQTQLQCKQIDVNGWADFTDIHSDFEFSDLESILATRMSLIRSIRQKEEREQIGTLLTPFAQALIDTEKKCLVRLSEAARAAGQIQIALNSIIRSQNLEKASTFEVSQEFASVLWLQKEEKLAVQYLRQLVAEMPLDDGINVPKKALLLARLGTWTSEACLEKPTDILTQFFNPATDLVAGIDSTEPLDPAYAGVYHQCAIFAEHQYHAILKSPDAIRWKMYADRKMNEIKSLREQIFKVHAGSKERKELEDEQRKAETLLIEDNVLFQQHNGARDAFLTRAIDMYSRCLEISDAFDDDGSIRLCSLWFANFDENPLQETVRVALDRVPSRKFVFLAHQLAARLSKSQTGETPTNQENLQKLILRMCEEHPFHSLYQVYCLLPGPHPSAPKISTRQSSRHDLSESQSERAAAASDIFDRLRRNTSHGGRVRDLEHICRASLEWAQYPIKDNPLYKKRGSPLKVPEDALIRKVKNVQVPVMTAHTPLDSTLRYDNCVWIERYDTTFETAGGVHLPKICICRGSNGERYKQLFKGEGGDDLRQDAVMEQVFDLVNTVLRRDRETRRRNLRVRDYKVIPLGAQAGVLEFVGNTTTLLGWLQKAHARYRPSDLKALEVQSLLKAKRDECKSRAEPLLALFLDIRKRFKPVMRHYFTECHKIPISWFTMRLNYTRSVATTSIVGHVLGLGDRHASNILLDNVTGEVVHIDLGIAFDQGKLLPVPERVPFRMTADMVDGMGISGTQGVFQRCAEETLRVLRGGSEVIMTVLEVFKYDPLHSWTASELKVKRVQGNPPESTVYDTARFGIGIDMTSGSAEEAADRALTSVARKLNKALSVEYTVNELIAEATDTTNLATIFHGWAPHL